ncbi:AAA family ATPase [Photobacterium damselae]|uniref:AAA family ATPase n=1 Tax=Photobacterium damselae TaxID=38293 RepID=UPI001F2201AA|nr:AAA family ATPase [Photobacterium damselae]UKA01949.1 AAA family ATPase [Photobacterium damselae subsp. damselae]
MGNVFIEKVQVEGGFLDGMSLEMKNGLNTVIGARGTGKSTFIELIRYCLNIKGHTAESHAKSLAHAKSVLKDGQVIVTLSDGANSYSFSRTADGETIPPVHNDIQLPLIFSQTEVENIGLVSSGRLKLIDDFIGNTDSLDLIELSSISQIESYSSEIIKLSDNVSETEDRLIALPKLKLSLDSLMKEQEALTTASEDVNSKSKALSELSDHYLKVTSDIEQLKDYISTHERTRDEIYQISLSPRDELTLSDSVSSDEYSKMSESCTEAYDYLDLAFSKFDELIDVAQSELGKLLLLQSDITKKGQGLRAEVDTLQKGAGELSRKIQICKEEIAKLENIEKSNHDKAKRIESVKQDRNIALAKLDGVRSEKSQKREQVCNMLSQALAPRIRVNLEERSQLDEYQQVIINALKGSGIKYNELAPLIAESVPPQMLLKIIEEDDIDSFLSMLSITKDRASRVINALKSSIHSVATVNLEDEVILELLDGSETKGLAELSTGQRCTVILPIILAHKDSALIVDQPEDHIDNAFIVETLIASIKRRKGQGQTIVTTHNANVPVLGEAEEVIHLNSDGTRGYVLAYGPLMQPNIVDAISSVMEGGREAFRCRANFYE